MFLFHDANMWCEIWGLSLIIWRFQMETFSVSPALCERKASVIGGFPHKKLVTRSFGVFFDLHPNKRLSKQSRRRWFQTPSCSLLRHCNEPFKCRSKHAAPLQWRHNGRDSVSNPQPRDCLLNRLFRRRSNKTSKLCVTGLCAGNSPETDEFSAQMASYAEIVSIWWRHYAISTHVCELTSVW